MKIKLIFTSVALLAFALVLHADKLKLQGGKVIEGTLVSANAEEVVFMGLDGTEQSYPVSPGMGVVYAPLPPPPAPAPVPQAAAASVLTIPAGTQIFARNIDAIANKTAQPGQRVRGTIDQAVAVGSQVAIPAGTPCTLEVVQVSSGEGMAVRLRDVQMGGKVYGISAQFAEVRATGTSKTKSGVRRGVGLGALGAGIGAIAGGGSGAAIGAAVGGGVGATSAIFAKGKTLSLPAETGLIFTLTAPVPLN
jgi:hypothetical protein